MREYADWAGWAQAPAGNIVERNEELSNYVQGLTWNAYISGLGTSYEPNDGRTQETAALNLMIFDANR